MVSNTTAIKTSGYNTVIMFGVGILADGGIMYYSNTAGSIDVLVATNGSYVGGAALSAKVQSLKTGSTNITRVEICMNSQHVQDLMTTPGPGSTTLLYRNFAALKAAWTLDAVNNDDESLYNVASTVSFGKMLGAIGYKYSISPYTNKSFWVSVKTAINLGLATPILDRCYLQCYDGGAGNVPKSWGTSLGLGVVPLLWVVNDSKPAQGSTPAQAKTKFTAWNKASALAGGGYWNDYDIERMGSSYTAYGAVLTALFP